MLGSWAFDIGNGQISNILSETGAVTVDGDTPALRANIAATGTHRPDRDIISLHASQILHTLLLPRAQKCNSKFIRYVNTAGSVGDTYVVSSRSCANQRH